MLRFPEGFLWGAATSSHQVEGHNEGNDWWEWEQRPGLIRDGTCSGAACEWWTGRAERDLALAAELGHNAHRLSLEWSRLEPEPSRYSVAAFDRYRAIFEAAARAGLVLMVTLNHFTLPRWASAHRGWCEPSLAERFADFAEQCAKRLGDLADLWATLNEPNVLAFMAYAGHRWPPGLGDPRAGFSALGHMLRAHRLARSAFRAERTDARVGLVLNVPRFEAARMQAVRDRAAARAQDWAMSGVVIAALHTGWLWPPLSFVPRLDGELRGAIDFMGLNYYGRYRVRFDPRLGGRLFGRHVQNNTVRTEWTDWGEPSPEGLRAQLVRLGALGVPIYVTENGVQDRDDVVRRSYLVSHIGAVHAAIADGVDVRGYFHWSLMDNFEWAEGWASRFGLVALDRASQSRQPRDSALLYREICRANSLEG